MVKETKLYDILEISTNATEKEIKKAFRNKALIYHPDKKTGNSEKFKEISEAYEILSNNEKRQLYDQHGESFLKQNNQGGFNTNDLFGGMFGGMFGNMNQGQCSNIPDVLFTYNISLEDIYNGKNIELKYPRTNLCEGCNGCGSSTGKTYICNNCNGKGIKINIIQLGPGMIQQMQSHCDKCKGSGESLNDNDKCKKCNGAKTNVIINNFNYYMGKGFPRNAKSSIDNEGNIDPKTKRRSKLIINFNIENHILFIQNDNNIIMKTNISLIEALCGFKKPIQHFNKNTIVFENTYETPIKNGETRIIKNMGMPVFQSNNFGDLIIEFTVDYPDIDIVKKNEDLIKKYF